MYFINKTKKILLKFVKFAIIKFIVMGVVENKKDALIYDWYGRDKLYRALNELAGITRKDIMAVIGAKNNKQLSAAFTFHKKCFTLEMIEQFAYLLRNVEGWDLNAILEYVKLGEAVTKTSQSNIELKIAQRLYKKNKHVGKFYLDYIYTREFSPEEIERYKARKKLIRELPPR